MFPLDLVVVSNVVKWLGKVLYFKVFATKYYSLDGLATDNLNTNHPKDVYYTGTVIEIRDDVAFIDGRYTFSTSQINRDVFVGDIVTCVINSNRSGVLSDLTVIDILSNDDSNLEAAPNENSKAYGVITKRQDRIFTVSPGPLEFDLDLVDTKFIPEVGDHIDLFVKKNAEDEIQVVNIIPRGYKVISGCISSYDNGSGFINESIVFQKYHCQPGYQPQKYDRVVLSIIRCQNGSTQYRALHVSPLMDSKRTHDANDSLIIVPNFISDIIFHPTEVICVNLDESKIIDAELVNYSSTEYKLLKLKAYTSESLIELVDPSDLVLSFKPNSKIDLKFKVFLKYVGFCTITFDFIFENFVFNCNLNLLAIGKGNDFLVSQLENDQKTVSNISTEQRKPVVNLPKYDFTMKAPIPGRHFRGSVRFFPVKLGSFDLPNKILTIFKEGGKGGSVKNDIETYCPCLSVGLKPINYKIFMHCLLYFEEVSLLEKISQIEMTSGFEKRNDFLILFIDDETKLAMIQTGDKVLARKPWEPEGDVFEGIIWQLKLKELFIKFGKKFHDSYVPRSEYIINFVMSRSQLRLKHQSVDDVMHNLGVKWLFPNQTTFSPPFIIRVEDESEQNCLGSHNKNRSNIKWNRQGSGYGNRQFRHTLESVVPVERKRVIKWFNGDLNAEQKNAVVNCLGAETRPYPYVIFGPPGTGKSMTLIELCLQVYNLIPESKIILVAPSNSAVDQLSLNIIGSGFIEEADFVRLGSYRYVSGGNVPDGLVKYVCLPIMSDDDNEECVSNINRYSLSEKRVIVSTIGTIGTLRSMGFPYGYFTHYIIDEAGQLMEPENLIITSLMSKDSHLILAGDPQQLGPVIYSFIAKRYGLGCSFLQRLMEFKPYLFDKLGFPESYGYNPQFITKLVRSYRALPKLLQLISQLFYRDELKSMVNEVDSREAAIYCQVKEIFPVESDIPILFHSVNGRESLEEGKYSFYNSEEVFQICTYLSQLYSLGIEPDQIGIITPYIAQVRKIVQFLDILNQEIPKIGSVEEFQGQEKDIILVSTVRSSAVIDNVNIMSFIFNPQRINVSISRAKAVLIIVGNSPTLSNNDVWKSIIRYTIDHRSFRQ